MTFLYPPFLLALFAVAIPVIIHLIELRKSKRVLFTNVRFIREVKQVTSHHRRLKHILVLLARIFFINFLVLTFAQPLLPASNPELRSIADLRFFINNSLRMQNEALRGEVSMFEAAVDDAKSLLASLPTSSNIFVFDNQGGSSSLSPLTPGQAEQRINEFSLIPQALPFETVFSRISFPKKEAGGDFQAFIFSDFQRGTFDPTILEQVDSSAQYFLVPIQAASTKNIFVDSVYLDDEFVRVAENNTLFAELVNAGGDVQNVLVKLLVGDQQVSALSLEIAAGEKALAEFSFQLPSYGVKSCRIEIEDYPVTFDNTFYFTLEAAPKINVLDILGSSPAPTQRLYTNEPIFNYSSTEISRLNFGALASSDVVLLNGVANVDPGVADNLGKYLREGGTVVIIPAGTADRSSYSRFFSDLGLGQVSWKSAGGPRELAVPDFQNPFFSKIFTEQTRGMQMPQADQMLTWSRSSTNILKYWQGGNFLSSFAVGGTGTLYLFASPLTPTYSEFSNHAIFVPIMYKLAIRSYASGQQMAYTIGQGPVRFETGGFDIRKTVFKLIRDSVEFIPEQRQQGGNLVMSTPPEMLESGIYRLIQGDSVVTSLAFNYDKRNSYLDQYSPEELREIIGDKYPNVKVYETSGAGAVKEQFTRDNVGTPLWKYCLLLALLFLMIEIALIRFM